MHRHSTLPGAFSVLRRFLIIGAAALSGAALPGLLWAQSDDFNDGDDAGWSRYDPISTAPGGVAQNTWSFPGGAYRLQANPSPSAATLGPARAGSFRPDVTYTDFHLNVDLVKWDGDRTNAFGLVGRIQPAIALGQTSAYIFGYVAGDHYVSIVRIDRERTRAIAGSLPLPIRLNTNQAYRFTFTGRGPQLTGRVFALNDLFNPIAVVTATESSYSEGTAGLLGFAVNGGSFGPLDVTFDNYTATDRDRPRLATSLSIFGELSVSWPAFEGEGYILQCAPSLTAPVEWTDITSGVNPIGDQKVYDAGTPGGNNFYRLKKMP